MNDLFDKIVSNKGPLGQYAKVAEGYFAFPKLEGPISNRMGFNAVSYTHLRAHETGRNLVCRLLLEKKKKLIYNLLLYTKQQQMTRLVYHTDVSMQFEVTQETLTQVNANLH